MITTQFPNELKPLPTRAGRMLTEGDVRVTVTDFSTSEHITVRFKCIRDNRPVSGTRPVTTSNKNWLRTQLHEATHVFVEVPSASGEFADKVGTFYPKTGRWFKHDDADDERVHAAMIAAHWLNGGDGVWNAGFRLQEESYCGKCGITLTDPVSIDRGIGPECYRQITGSKHQAKRRQLVDHGDSDNIDCADLHKHERATPRSGARSTTADVSPSSSDRRTAPHSAVSDDVRSDRSPSDTGAKRTESSSEVRSSDSTVRSSNGPRSPQRVKRIGVAYADQPDQVRSILTLITALSDDDQERVRNELNVWAGQAASTLFSR